MKSFQHLSPELRLYLGSNALEALGRELDRSRCDRVLVVCGRSVASHPHLLPALGRAIGKRLIATFDAVKAHSPLSCVQEASDMMRSSGADAVLAVGGGSAIVTARAAAICLGERRPLSELATHRNTDGSLVSPKLSAPKLPQFVVLTTPTTAAVKAGSAVLDEFTHRRQALFDPKTRARAVFMDPMFAASAPPALVRAAGFNVLAMTLEGLESKSGQPLADADLLQALHLAKAALRILSTNVEEIQSRLDLMLSAVLCGRGTDHAGGGICSALSHAGGARFGIDNGMVNAVLLPHTTDFNDKFARIRPCDLFEDISEGDEATGIRRGGLRGFLASAGAPSRLRDLGIPKSALGEIASAAMEDWFIQRNPRPVHDHAELEELLQRAW